jgi:hypothetical protein
MRHQGGGITTEVMRLSTSGMIEYRRGRPDVGRALYLQALEKAAEAGLERLRARASIFMAMEERRAKTPEWPKARELAAKLAKGFYEAELRLLVDRMR